MGAFQSTVSLSTALCCSFRSQMQSRYVVLIISLTPHTDAEEEWNDYKSLNDSVLHIDLRSWADICVVAPLSAHTLSKIANGLCDDLLTCILRAWDFGNNKPVVLAPAMNTAMWEHPLTTMQLNTIKNFHNDVVKVVHPIAKTLACGDVGVGALADLNDIVTTVDQCLQHSLSNDVSVS